MTWQDYLLVFGFIFTLFESVVLLGIYFDDHWMRILAEQALQVQKDSLAAQKEYLKLRLRWYESRGKKKADDIVGPKAT